MNIQIKEKRTKSIKIRLSERELCHVNKLVKNSGLSREAYMRSLVCGFVPCPKPTIEYLEIIKQLRAIGNNLNQIAVVAHKTNAIDILRYKSEVQNLKEELVEIKRLASQPFSIEEIKNGSNSNLES